MPKEKNDTRSQRQKFEDAAREAGCDLDESEFDQVLGGIGQAEPKSLEEVAKDAKRRREKAEG